MRQQLYYLGTHSTFCTAQRSHCLKSPARVNSRFFTFNSMLMPESNVAFTVPPKCFSTEEIPYLHRKWVWRHPTLIKSPCSFIKRTPFLQKFSPFTISMNWLICSSAIPVAWHFWVLFLSESLKDNSPDFLLKTHPAIVGLTYDWKETSFLS